MRVTEHFDSSEFDCHDRTPYPLDKVDDEGSLPGMTWLETRLTPLCQTLEVIREASNGPIKVDSGYRTLEYDDRIYQASGGDGLVAPAAKSQHPKGRAADITHPTMPPIELFKLVLGLYVYGKLPQLGGIGLYPRFIHVDVRPKPTVDGKPHLAIWGGERPSNVI